MRQIYDSQPDATRRKKFYSFLYSGHSLIDKIFAKIRQFIRRGAFAFSHFARRRQNAGKIMPYPQFLPVVVWQSMLGFNVHV